MLKHLDISWVLMERNARVDRYEALCPHDHVGYDHLPYLLRVRNVSPLSLPSILAGSHRRGQSMLQP